MIWILISLMTQVTFANELTDIRVGGDERAEITFYTNGNSKGLPSIRFENNTIEVTLKDMVLPKQFDGKIDLASPHTLINRLSAYAPRADLLRTRIVIKGSTEKLKERVTVSTVPEGIRLSIAYPAQVASTMELLKQEDALLIAPTVEKEKAESTNNTAQLFIAIMVILMAAVVTYFAVRFLRKKGHRGGSRKYLIEQMSYCALGTKSGVALLRVGNEFVLVGITPNQITQLSSMTNLQKRYEDESSFERDAFSDVVKQEFNKLKSANA